MKTLAAQWDFLRQDLRYTVRTLNRGRGFALTAILVTALGVGANTAAFSVADFVLLRSLPFADPDALVRLCEGPRTGGGWGCMNELSPANYRDWKTSDYSLYDELAQHLIAHGVMCEPDSREPWFISAAHDRSCLEETLDTFEYCVDVTLEDRARAHRPVAEKLMPGISA